MCEHIVRRGYVESDIKQFSDKEIPVLKKAQEEIFWLLNRGYNVKNVSTFVGNHYMLSERQRIALARATSSLKDLEIRKEKRIKNYNGNVIYIDGFNLIITLEVALSNSTIIKCMDETFRDLAGLRGTYRLIDKTDSALKLIAEKLQSMNIKKAVFYLDSPVSNTGRLKQKILEIMENFEFEVEVELVKNADIILMKKNNVVSTDAIILNNCISWINLSYEIITENIKDLKIVNLDGSCITLQ